MFAVLPTGYGKTLIYQLLPLVYDHMISLDHKSLTLVVSPLQQLMKEQVQKLNSAGVSALLAKDYTVNDLNSELKKASFLFDGPENLPSGSWRKQLQSSDLLKS